MSQQSIKPKVVYRKKKSEKEKSMGWIFSSENLPLTVVVALIVWAYISFFSVIL